MHSHIEWQLASRCSIVYIIAGGGMEPLLLMAVLVCAVHSVASLPLSPKDYRRSRHYDEQLKELRMGLEVAGSVMVSLK